MNRLLDIGFELAGHWFLVEGKLKYELLRHSTQRNILYAFVRDGEVMYVGKTIRTLATRMAGYRDPGPSQTTNVNNNRRISEILASGQAVEILALPDNGLLHYGSFHVNLAAGLEDDIIRKLDPPWNGGRPEEATKAISVPLPTAPATPEPEEPQPSFLETFRFKLQPTYYRTGFFNIGVSAQKFLGADGATVELYLEEGVKPVLGMINRRANTNGTPRIMGGTGLRDWFQLRARELDEIAVQVLSPTALRLAVADA